MKQAKINSIVCLNTSHDNGEIGEVIHIHEENYVIRYAEDMNLVDVIRKRDQFSVLM